MPNQELTYAGFWIRVAASLIDTVLILIVFYPIVMLLYGPENFDFVEPSGVDPMAEALFLHVLPAVAIILFWVYRQATPGKMAIQARIVDATTGGPPSTGQCIGRYLAYIPSTLFFGLGLLWVAFDPRKQGWHDKLAGTLVVRTVGKVPSNFMRGS